MKWEREGAGVGGGGMQLKFRINHERNKGTNLKKRQDLLY